MRILIIDDDAIVQETLSILLQDMGHEVQGLRSAPLRAVMADGGSPDLIICDVLMAGVRVFDLFGDILWANPNAKIIATTAGGDILRAQLAKTALGAGAVGILAKPFVVDELRRKISALSNTRAVA